MAVLYINEYNSGSTSGTVIVVEDHHDETYTIRSEAVPCVVEEEELELQLQLQEVPWWEYQQVEERRQQEALLALRASLPGGAPSRRTRFPTRDERLTVRRHGAHFRGQGSDGVLN